MRSVGFICEDAAMPRTVFYERFKGAVCRNPAYRENGADLLIPAEDTANETNWPRYGNPDSAYVRGSRPDLSNEGIFFRYMDGIARYAYEHNERRVLIVNMHPFLRLPVTFKPLANVIVADGSLANFERALNPRTISIPALPLVTEPANARHRDVLASFQGAPSHPLRHILARLHDGKDFVIKLVDTAAYAGRIDMEGGATDGEYESLLDRSVFAFVPRGDALFSYRLLETMARGAIPVVLSDGWVLPFDRLIDWANCSVRFHHEAVHRIPETLRAFMPEDILRMQRNVRGVYARVFANLDRIVASLFEEAAILVDGKKEVSQRIQGFFVSLMSPFVFFLTPLSLLFTDS